MPNSVLPQAGPGSVDPFGLRPFDPSPDLAAKR